ncbi:MAG: hypothetical protein ACTTK5_04590 [Candidatus Fimenecus sp.]
MKNEIKKWCADNGFNYNRLMELYQYLYADEDITCELLEEEFDNDTLTVNKGRDGQIYYWHMDWDGNMEAAIRLSDGYIVDDDDEIDKLFC